MTELKFFTAHQTLHIRFNIIAVGTAPLHPSRVINGALDLLMIVVLPWSQNNVVLRQASSKFQDHGQEH